jgi:hypothetical protein
MPTILESLHIYRRHPEVLAVLHGEPRRMGHERIRPSFETPRKRAAPQDDGGVCAAIQGRWARLPNAFAPGGFAHPTRFVRHLPSATPVTI